MGEEKMICEVRPSQILNLGAFLICFIGMAAIITLVIYTGNNVLLALLIIPVIYALWKYLEIQTTTLKLTDQRIIIRKGIFNKTTKETELYRVRDSSIEEPFFYRLFGCGNVLLYTTTDESDANIRLTAYKKPHWLKDQVRNYSESCRKNMRWGNDNVLMHDHGNDVPL
ncbi:MAG TPA: PH domain-containing protein [Flavisolibacter sp.]|jgi:uncharacterized membrane protein YdbT with pleckstrin-like domain|nr:PH domain-containing protein [Flavisolibacter sp.]